VTLRALPRCGRCRPALAGAARTTETAGTSGQPGPDAHREPDAHQDRAAPTPHGCGSSRVSDEAAVPRVPDATCTPGVPGLPGPGSSGSGPAPAWAEPVPRVPRAPPAPRPGAHSQGAAPIWHGCGSCGVRPGGGRPRRPAAEVTARLPPSPGRGRPATPRAGHAGPLSTSRTSSPAARGDQRGGSGLCGDFGQPYGALFFRVSRILRVNGGRRRLTDRPGTRTPASTTPNARRPPPAATADRNPGLTPAEPHPCHMAPKYTQAWDSRPEWVGG
jgi:hypothetical protein